MDDDDFWEMMFFLFADWRTIIFVLIVLAVLSLLGVIPWNQWL